MYLIKPSHFIIKRKNSKEALLSSKLLVKPSKEKGQNRPSELPFLSPMCYVLQIRSDLLDIRHMVGNITPHIALKYNKRNLK